MCDILEKISFRSFYELFIQSHQSLGFFSWKIHWLVVKTRTDSQFIDVHNRKPIIRSVSETSTDLWDMIYCLRARVTPKLWDLFELNQKKNYSLFTWESIWSEMHLQLRAHHSGQTALTLEVLFSENMVSNAQHNSTYLPFQCYSKHFFQMFIIISSTFMYQSI